MAYKINLHDTHRTPYNNAVITAHSAVEGSTDVVEFEDFYGNNLGAEVRTNARGFLCDANGALYTSGVFVPEDSVITVTLGDGTTTSWVVGKGSTTPVNDAKLYNADKSKVLFTANAGQDFLLSYYDLSDKPIINEWGREEQTVQILETTDTVNVSKLTTFIHLWSNLSYDDFDTDPVNDPAITLTLQTTVQPPSFGQRISVYNTCNFRVKLVNDNGSFIATVGRGMSKQIAACSSPDGSYIYFIDEDAESNDAEVVSIARYTTESLEINDYSSNTILITERNEALNSLRRPLVVSQNLSYKRDIILWWQPRFLTENLILQNEDGYQFLKLKPFSPTLVRFSAGSVIDATVAPVAVDGDNTEFGLPAEVSTNVVQDSSNPIMYNTGNLGWWPTGATSVNLTITNPPPAAVTHGTAPLVTIHLLINEREKVSQLIRIVFENIDTSAGTKYRVRFKVHKRGPDMVAQPGNDYLPLDNQEVGCDCDVINWCVGGKLEICTPFVAFFQVS